MYSLTNILGFGLSLVLVLLQASASPDYTDALKKSLLYFEAQRSGKLPANQRVSWRADSALLDGSDAGVDLVGGYYDAGDNVKFGFPMAFTTTMLAWSVVEYGRKLEAKNELSNALEALKWGTDYIVKAHPHPNVLFGENGDGDSDHRCWERSEEMDTPRASYKIDEQNPGSDLAAESAAALAAASIAFSKSNSSYSSLLLIHAKQLFVFARNHQGMYHYSIPIATIYYQSSGYQDELLWAAAWLYSATGDKSYLDFLAATPDVGDTRTEFSWDDKYVGVQVLVGKLVLEGKVPNEEVWAHYKGHAEEFICKYAQKGSNNFKVTNGGLLIWGNQDWNVLQYTSTSAFIALAYSDYLNAAKAQIDCPGGLVDPTYLVSFAQSQVDYVLGSNPKKMSYMVGFGSNYPKYVHHRGASIPSIKVNSTFVGCNEGYKDWHYKPEPNPNVLYGAIVGGPRNDDSFDDKRTDFKKNEPTTVNTAPFVGVLARLSS